MGSQQQRTWWQEMGAISRGLMFIEGSIATPASLQPREEGQHGGSAPAPQRPAQGRLQASSLRRKARWLLEELVLLGGRPVSAGHNDDIDEPFPPLHHKSTGTRRQTAKHSRAGNFPRKCAMR